MNMSPAISIVLPTYNGSRHLRTALDSCMGQTFRNFELIIVDDCSTDNTPSIIDEYAACDERIRIHRHDTNRKLPAALNTGFTMARGGYFTWMSDDNILDPLFLETLSKTLDTHPEAGLVYSAFLVIDDSGRPLKRVDPEPAQNLLLRNVVLASFMYRREVRDTIGDYNDDCFLCEDYDYWLRIYSRFALIPVPKVLHQYRDHPGSLTSREPRRRVEAHLDMLLENEPLFERHPQRAYLTCQIGHVHRMLGDQKGARHYYRKARDLDFLIYLRRAVIGPLAWPIKKRWLAWTSHPRET